MPHQPESIQAGSAAISPLEILRRLIRFDTTNPHGNEAPCIEWIRALLEGAGIETRVLAADDSRPNLISRIPGAGASPPLLLYGHVDVVTTEGQSWSHPPFAADIADGCVWGRGALDMKGGVAMMISAFLRARADGLVPAGDVILAILSDEEAGGEMGAKFLVERYADLFSDVRYAIGEFGGFTLHLGGEKFFPIMVAEKSFCRVVATVRGPGGHGSLPVRGGAMAKLAGLLRRLDRNPMPVNVIPVVRRMVESIASALPFPQGFVLRRLLNPSMTEATLRLLGDAGTSFGPLLHNTASPTVITASRKINVIPSEISVELDCRLLPGFTADELLKELREIAGEGVELTAECDFSSPAAPDMELFDTLASILREADHSGTPIPFLLPAVTDGRHFSKLGIQTYGFTPMILPPELNFTRLIHAADERIPVDSLEFGANAIYQVLRRF